MLPDLPRLLIESYARWTGLSLVDLRLPDEALAAALWELDRVVVAHDTQADPVFQYGNRMALELFEMDFATFTRLPSRQSAEPVHQSERQKLLEEVRLNGYSDSYSGVRVSRTGKRFRIANATIWNVVDAEGKLHGQAACFSEWAPLPSCGGTPQPLCHSYINPTSA